MNMPPLKFPLTPAGKPVTVAPVAVPPTWYTMFEIAVFTQRTCAVFPENKEIVCPCTFIEPVVVADWQVPEVVIV